MSGMSGGGGSAPSTTTTNTKWNPPDYVMQGGRNGPMGSYMSYAAQTLGKPYIQYGGQQSAGPSTQEQMGWQIGQQRALNGNQLAPYADQNFKNTMSGAYMNNNPYLQGALNFTQQDTTKNFQNAVMPQLNNAFARNKAFGGSAYEQQLGQAQGQLANELGRNASNAYLGNYNQERNNQMQLMNYADQAGQRDYQDAAMLQNIGQQQNQYLNNYLGQGQGQFNEARNFLNENLGRFQNVMGGLTGQGNSSTTAPNPYAQGQGSNKLAGAMGGAMTGMGAFNMLNDAAMLGTAPVSWPFLAGGAALGLLG